MALSIPIITEYVGTGLDKFRRELAQAQTSSQRAGLVMKKAFIPATAALGALGTALFDATKAAMEDEAAAVELARSLRQTTGATDAIIASTEEWITQQGKLLGVTDDKLRPAISRLARATGDVNTAQRLATQAMDIAVATGKPLETVVQALERAYGGNMTALQKLAPEYRTLIKDGADFETVMRALAETTGGAASESANTAQGRFERLKVSLDETKESIGASLQPAVEALLPVLEDFATWAEENPDTFRNVALAIGAVAAATVAVNAAMAVNPYVAAAAGIATMALAFDQLYKAVDKLSGVGGIGARVLGFLFGGATGKVSSMFKVEDFIRDIFGVKPGRSIGKGDGFSSLDKIPGLASGGIVTRPTLAMIGEGGESEAVIPLSKLGNIGGGTNVTINVQGADPQAVVDALRTYMFRNGSVPIKVA